MRRQEDEEKEEEEEGEGEGEGGSGSGDGGGGKSEGEEKGAGAGAGAGAGKKKAAGAAGGKKKGGQGGNVGHYDYDDDFIDDSGGCGSPAQHACCWPAFVQRRAGSWDAAACRKGHWRSGSPAGGQAARPLLLAACFGLPHLASAPRCMHTHASLAEALLRPCALPSALRTLLMASPARRLCTPHPQR